MFSFYCFSDSNFCFRSSVLSIFTLYHPLPTPTSASQVLTSKQTLNTPPHTHTLSARHDNGSTSFSAPLR